MVDFGGGSFSENRYTWPTALISIDDIYSVSATDDAGNNQIISAQVWVGDASGVINPWNLQKDLRQAYDRVHDRAYGWVRILVKKPDYSSSDQPVSISSSSMRFSSSSSSSSESSSSRMNRAMVSFRKTRCSSLALGGKEHTF